MLNYSYVQTPVMLESHSITNIVVPQTYQIHHVSRQLGFAQQIPQKTQSKIMLQNPRYPSPCQNLIRTTQKSIYQHAANKSFNDSVSNLTQRVIPLVASQTNLVRTDSNLKPLLPKFDLSTHDVQKSQIQIQLDKIFNKLGTMDQSLNDLTQTVLKGQKLNQSSMTQLMKSPIKSTDQDQESTRHELSSTFGLMRTPVRGRMLTEHTNKSSNRQQTFENISRIQLSKGVKFGDTYYFGDLNKNGLKEGHGTLYNLKSQIIYCGYWLNDQYHNRGKLYFYNDDIKSIDLDSFYDQRRVDSNKISYTGQFDCGEIKGLGQMLFSKGRGNQKLVFYGRFIAGIFNGHGTVIEYNQTLDNEQSEGFEGDWKNGRCQAGKQYSPKKYN